VVSGADQVYFSATQNITTALVQRINAENVRIDMSAWYLTERTVSTALVNRMKAGVPVRLIGDRVAIFENDLLTKREFYWLASQGVPIRLRYNPTWVPEVDHWKATIFAGQNIVAFGSANYTPFELAPVSSTNYKDEVVLFSDDPVLVRAFKTKFDQYWNDTTPEPESLVPSPPYLRDWDQACANESACSDYRTTYPNRVPMVIDTRRLEPDHPLPPDVIWGQGRSFNTRLSQEITNATTSVDFVVYRLTVPGITNALVNKFQSGTAVRVIIEPSEYGNRRWPEFWLTHAYVDKLWAAGIPIKQRVHAGLTHMKLLITPTYATIASSNYAAAWQRDHNYFVSADAKPSVYQAIKNRFEAMWTDSAGFGDFAPQPADAAVLRSPASGAVGLSTSPTLVWNTATFATDYDVLLGTSASTMTRVANVPAQLVNGPPSTYSWAAPTPLQPATTYFWQIVSRTFATVRNGSIVARSPVWSFKTAGSEPPPPPPPSGGTLPAPWVTQDVGSVGSTGSASASNGTFTVSGAGSDIWGPADSFRYAYQTTSGDVQIVARAVSLQNTHTWAKAGLMLRASLTSSAAHVTLNATPGGTIEFSSRASAGGTGTVTANATHAAPVWLKLVRSGSTVTGYVSATGATWTTVGSTTVSFGAANIGMAVTSHNTAVLNTATFDNVGIEVPNESNPPPPPPPSLAAPWVTQDVGSVGRTGSASTSNGTFTVSGAGSDIWGPADSFRYVYQTTSGDVQIVARAVSLQNTHTWAKAGLMLRAGLTSSAAHVTLNVTPGGTIEFSSRASAGGTGTVTANATQAAPVWLKLVRSGSTVTGYVSATGTTWTTVGSTTVSFDAANIGMVVTSHNTAVLNTATFDNVSAGVTIDSTPPPPSLAAPWVTQDVGSVGRTGSASASNGTFTVSGAGSDIWGPADSFRYVHQGTSGDVQIVARAVSLQNTHTWAKAGVMLRAGLTSSAAHVTLNVTPGGTIEFSSRASAGGTGTVTANATQATPVWLKLVRSGSTVTGYVSATGTTWTTVGSTTVSFDAANIGMAVTSHDTGVLNTATFDNVSVGVNAGPVGTAP
jgi:phosphatidylserine/phosphatidylglycerophosphate/cardiolipin synthase-like enzyme